MNWLKFLVAFAAFCVAGCAAYFSVTGLGILFSGASIAVMVMASALELSKLVAASYLKQVWDEIGGFLKFYLVLAVVILMIITSAGIFGYLSNAFQQQNLKIQQVDREIAVWQSKIDNNKEQIGIFNEQLVSLQQNQTKIIDLQRQGGTNSRLFRSLDGRDKQIFDISQKIEGLQSQNSSFNDTINKIKVENIDIEREVGGFRFVAEAFGVELNTVVKFFIFLIVFVFDPMAIALVIAFNNLVRGKHVKINEKSTKNDLKTYEIYGEKPDFTTKEDIIESNNVEIPINTPETVVEDDKSAEIVETTEPLNIKKDTVTEISTNQDWLNSYNGAPYYTNPDFPWHEKQLWQNDQKAVQYWLTQKKK